MDRIVHPRRRLYTLGAALALLCCHATALADAPEILPRDRPLVLVCSIGARSAGAAGHLRNAAFDDVAHLRGGLAEWSRLIDPSLTVL